MSILVIGYSVEYLKDNDLAERFLKKVHEVHSKSEAPCTLYLVADIVEQHAQDLEPLVGNPLFDLQICTRLPMKTVCQMADGQTTLWRGADVAQTIDDVSAVRESLKTLFGVNAIGVSSPLGYYRGFMDRPDILEALHREGIRFTRSYGRNRYDWQPVDFSIDPFWYTFQGFADMLEFPGQGWQDSLIRPIYGWEDVEGYTDYLKGDVDETARREDYVWSYWAHDWAVLREDDDLATISALVSYAREQGVDVSTQQNAYSVLREREHDLARKNGDPS
jgi:hypothetical protein